MKKIITVALVLFLSVSVLTGCGSKKKEEDNYNTNKGVIEDQEQNGLTFTNTSLKVSETGSTLVTVVTNTTENDIEVRIFNIIVKDKKGVVLTTLKGYVGDVIPAGTSKEITSNSDLDLSTATEITYEEVK